MEVFSVIGKLDIVNCRLLSTLCQRCAEVAGVVVSSWPVQVDLAVSLLRCSGGCDFIGMLLRELPGCPRPVHSLSFSPVQGLSGCWPKAVSEQQRFYCIIKALPPFFLELLLRSAYFLSDQ